MADPGSLQNLHDIVMPSPVPWWPPAPGWYAVCACIAVAVAWFFRQSYRHWRANGYRRAALRELNHLQDLIESGDRDPAMRKLPELLKRTAMSVWPREQIASLTGAGWLQFLDTSGNTSAFSQGAGRLLLELAYAGHQKMNMISNDQVRSLTRVIEKWIREHRVGQIHSSGISGGNNGKRKQSK